MSDSTKAAAVQLAQAASLDQFEPDLCKLLQVGRREAQAPAVTQEAIDHFRKRSTASSDLEAIAGGYLWGVIFFECGLYRTCGVVLDDLDSLLSRLAEPAGEWGKWMQANITARRALLSWKLGLYRELESFAETLIGSSQPPSGTSTPRLRAEAFFALAQARYRERRGEQSRQFLEQCVNCADEAAGREACPADGTQWLLMNSGLSILAARGSLALLDERMDESLQCYHRAYEHAQRAGLARQQAYALACQGRVHAYTGAAGPATRAFQQAEQHVGQVGHCWDVTLLCTAFKAEGRLRKAQAPSDQSESISRIERTKRLRNEAVQLAEQTLAIARETMGGPREIYRQSLRAAQIFGCACDRLGQFRGDSESMAEAEKAYAKARDLLRAVSAHAASSQEPYLNALRGMVEATIENHHGNFAAARFSYEESLQQMRQFSGAYRLLQLQLEYALFLREQSQVNTQRWYALALLAEGRQLASSGGYQQLTRNFEDQLNRIPGKEWPPALAHAWPQSLGAQEFQEAREYLARGLAHDSFNGLELLRNAMQDAGVTGEGDQALFSYLHELIETLKRLAAMKTPRGLDCEEFALQPLVEQCFERHQSRVGEITLVNVVTPQLSIRADRLLIGQALENLVYNAIKSFRTTQENQERRITVDARQDELWTHITVADTGPGIPPASQAELFQWNSSYHHTGLPFTDWIARKHGGSAALEWSEVGKGSRFVVRIASSLS